MAMNRVQFQPGLSMVKFIEQYGSQRQCERALEAARWPSGFRCPNCSDTRYSFFERGGRGHWQCCRCRKQTTVTAGTIFDSSKVPLTSWYLAMHLLTQSKNNVSALELKRHLGVSYPTAWLLKHKLMEVMAQREESRVLAGRVEIDDAYLGGERPRQAGRAGRGSENKIPFVVAVETTDDGKPRRVCFEPIRFIKKDIQAWANRRLAADATVYSDSLPSMKAGLALEITNHHAIRTGRGRASALHPEFQAVNIVLGNLKTAISGTYHAFDFAKYAPRYLAEVAYRFNRRFDLKSILPRLITASAQTGAFPLSQIRWAEAYC